MCGFVNCKVVHKKKESPHEVSDCADFVRQSEKGSDVIGSVGQS
jgi:hypothetical protein